MPRIKDLYEKKTTIATKAMTDIKDRTVTGIVSVTGVKDLGNDIIVRGAFKKTIKENLPQIKHLWQHNSYDPPIATIEDIREVTRKQLPSLITDAYPEATGGLQVTRKYLETARADEIFKGIESGAINEMSIGYRAVKVEYEEDEPNWRIRHLKELSLFDTSDVNWGMNPATVAQKTALPFIKTPYSPVDCEYSEATEIKSATVKDLKAMCALYDADKEEEKSHYLMPHHHCEAGHSVNFNAVKAAMKSLIDAHGPNISEEDTQGVHAHLAEHYKQFGKEAPEYQAIVTAYRANCLVDEMRDPELGKHLAPLIESVTDAIAAEPAIKSLTDMDRLRAVETGLNLLSL